MKRKYQQNVHEIFLRLIYFYYSNISSTLVAINFPILVEASMDIIKRHSVVPTCEGVKQIFEILPFLHD